MMSDPIKISLPDGWRGKSCACESASTCDCGEGSSPSACSADLSPEQIELAENLGAFLWESSTLRHGLFTPPQFSRKVKERIKQYFYEQNAESPTCETTPNPIEL